MGVSPAAETPQVACPRTPALKPRVPVLAQPRATAHLSSGMMRRLRDVSESPGSAPRPSRKHDSAASQSKPLTCVSEARSLASRRSPTRAAARCTMSSMKSKSIGVNMVTGIQTPFASHLYEQLSIEINMLTRMTFQRVEVFPRKAVSISPRHALWLPGSTQRSAPTTAASLQGLASQEGHILPRCRCNSTPLTSPIYDRKNEAFLHFLHISRLCFKKKTLLHHSQEGSAQAPLPLPVLQPVLLSLQSPTWPMPKKRLRCVFLQS